MFKDLTHNEIIKGLNEAAAKIPEGKKGAILIYGDNNELYATIALRGKDGWEFDLTSTIELKNRRVVTELFFGVKKTW